MAQQRPPSESPAGCSRVPRGGCKDPLPQGPLQEGNWRENSRSKACFRGHGHSALALWAPGVLGPGHATQWGVGLEAGAKVSPCLCLLRTFSYILRELPKVPTHVPVCVLGNYRDMGEHRVILPDDVRDFIDNLDRWVGQPTRGMHPCLPSSSGPGPGAMLWALRVQQEDLGPRTAEPSVGGWLPGTRQACGGRGCQGLG